MAVVVSKKVIKSAVKRNRIRRRLYEVIRRELPQLIDQTDLVYIVVSADVLIVPHDELQESVRRTLHAAQLYKADKN